MMKMIMTRLAALRTTPSRSLAVVRQLTPLLQTLEMMRKKRKLTWP